MRYAVCVITILLSPLLSSAEERPNIVFILADDLGYHDVGFTGAAFYETPHLDALRESGMKFERAYSGGPNCMPTRACLMSGMYTPRTQMWTPGGLSKGDVKKMKLLVPARGGPAVENFPSKLALKPDVVSIAEVLQPVGYTTARFGKWHLGPDTQGFAISDPSGKGGKIGSKYYGNIDVHEWLTDASVEFINQNKKNPFFLYLSHWDVHGPIRARKEVVEKYESKLSSRKWDRAYNTTYAAMIEALDTSVGRVMAALKKNGLENNTLVVFSSDNGGVPKVTSMKPLRGGKGSLFEGGVRVSTCMSWPKVIKAGSVCDTPVTSVDFLPTFAELAGADMPKSQPVDGASIVPLLKGRDVPDRSLFWHYPMYLQGNGEGLVHPVVGTSKMYWRGVPASMIMKGDWKLMYRFEQGDTLLYNLRDDSAEQNELSAQYPEKAAELLKELKQWQSDSRAIIPDEPNPAFGG